MILSPDTVPHCGVIVWLNSYTRFTSVERSSNALIPVQFTYSSPIWVFQRKRRFNLEERGDIRATVTFDGWGTGASWEVVTDGGGVGSAVGADVKGGSSGTCVGSGS
jgi:hypothetical protein